jgi:hypothetical protein
MSEQRNLNSSDDQTLIQGRTGNSQLDSLFADIANEPLVYSKEEAFNIMSNSVLSNAGTISIWTTRNIVIGAVLIVGLAGGLLWYSGNNSNKSESENHSGLFGLPSDGETSISAMPEDQIDNNAPEGVNSDPLNPNNNTDYANSIGSTSPGQLLNDNSNTDVNRSINAGASKDRKNANGSINNLATSKEYKVTSIDNASSQRAKTTVTQRFFVDGSAMVALDYNRQPAVITINPRGIEKLTIGNELIKAVDYPKYEALAIEAFQRAKIEPLSGPTHDANSATDIPEIMIKALLKRGLIKENQEFEFVLTAASACLNNKVLAEEIQLDLLNVLKDASGKELPKNGRIRIKR